MKTSWKRAVGFSNFVSGFIAPNGQQVPGWLELHPKESKFAYAIKRVMSQLQSLDPGMQTKLENIDIDNCATDKDGVILRDLNGTLSFTKSGLKARNTARAELLAAEDVEIQPYYATQIPEGLTDDELKLFSGFVIKPEEVQSMLEARLSEEVDITSVPENGEIVLAQNGLP